MPDLPRNPSERGILLRALRFYSDSCHAPLLIAECPFSVDTGRGAWVWRGVCGSA